MGAPPTADEVGQQDAEALTWQEIECQERSAELGAEYTARFAQAGAIGALERLAKRLTPEVKGRLTSKDLARVRRAYATRAFLPPGTATGRTRATAAAGLPRSGAVGEPVTRDDEETLAVVDFDFAVAIRLAVALGVSRQLGTQGRH
jgi:hypothetical protein